MSRVAEHLERGLPDDFLAEFPVVQLVQNDHEQAPAASAKIVKALDRLLEHSSIQGL
jgi:hypothetical protein